MFYFTKVNRYLITLLSHYWIITQFMFLNLQTKNEKSNEFLNKHRGSKCILKESKWHFKTKESNWIFFLLQCPGYGGRLMPTQDPSTFFFQLIKIHSFNWCYGWNLPLFKKAFWFCLRISKRYSRYLCLSWHSSRNSNKIELLPSSSSSRKSIRWPKTINTFHSLTYNQCLKFGQESLRWPN